MISSTLQDAFYEQMNNLTSDKIPHLSSLGIKEFGYRLFAPNHTIGFCTHKAWTQFSVEQNYAKEMSDHYSREVNNLINQDTRYCVRVGHRDPNSKFLEGLYSHGLWNTLVVYELSPDKVEGFYFVGSLENNKVMDTFLKKTDMFENFVNLIRKPINRIASEDRWKELATEFGGLDLATLSATSNKAQPNKI